ncbi:hypothetical protein [Halorhodospira halophila]|uniref:hypothetical protein n=1 Tax=Halorhodospira halophila TaxID=1053 RepID=UPI001912D4BE|nr:hypothetical protein [Halorhodospira halophila]MBK5935697.1 hypothetical protein [Halorhodospira halophila]
MPNANDPAKPLYETLCDQTADVLKQRLALLPSGGAGLNRKGDLVEAIHAYLSCDEALATIVAELAELERSAVAEVVYNWHGYFNAAAFQAKYGSVPEFFIYHFRGLSRNRKESKSLSTLQLLFYDRRIPSDLAARLAQLLCPPAPLAMATLDDEHLPQTIDRGPNDEAEPLRRTVTEPVVRQELPALLHLVAQGNVAVSAKTGLPGAATIERIDSVLLNGDWYTVDDENTRDPFCEGGPIRPIRSFAWPLLLQAGGLAKSAGGKLALTPRGKKALSQPLHEVVARLFERWQSKGAPDELRRVDLIKGQTSKGSKLSKPAQRRSVIAAALRRCPVGEWFEVDEFFRLMKAESYRFEVAGNPGKLYFSELRYGSLGYDGCCGFEILEARYTLAYLFEYLATLGLIDVAYILPGHAREADYRGHWGTDEFVFLSRYDGLTYLRLNDLGAYCLGLSEHYNPRLPERSPLLQVADDLSLTLLRPATPAEQLQLEQIARTESPGCWQLDEEALLKLGTIDEERARIHDFLTSAVAGDLPLELSDWLANLDRRATALTDAGPAQLIQCSDAAIAAMLSSDPATAAHCLHVSDRLLCIPHKKLNAFRKGVATLGLVLPDLKPWL